MKIYLVGGAVRDGLLGKETKDHDYVVVGASEEELRAKYGPSVGADFPVFMDVNGDQYAMARKERKVAAGYHGFDVEFGKEITLKDDLFRRDLTINAMAQDLETGEIHDFFGGKADLENKILRHVSEAFAEDPLRVVRLARFASRYTDFSIAAETVLLAKQVVNSGEMDALPFERYWAEIDKVMKEGDPAIFFNVIHSLAGFEKIKFFREVWGDHVMKEGCVSSPKSYLIKIADVMHEVLDTDRLDVFVSMTCDPDSAWKPASARMSELVKIIESFELIFNVNSDQVMTLLKKARTFQQGSLIELVIVVQDLFKKAGFFVSINPNTLREIVKDARTVTSEPFQHLQGKEIGVAMEEARRNIIKKHLGEE